MTILREVPIDLLRPLSLPLIICTSRILNSLLSFYVYCRLVGGESQGKKVKNY